MLLFNQKSTKLTTLKETSFKLEREIQNLFEANITAITGLQLIKSEFSIKNNRIDTLAFDAESHSFVIIEYKRDKNYSVVDQAFLISISCWNILPILLWNSTKHKPFL
jgi:RecB family endonuclease NucS